MYLHYNLKNDLLIKDCKSQISNIGNNITTTNATTTNVTTTNATTTTTNATTFTTITTLLTRKLYKFFLLKLSNKNSCIKF